MKRVVPQRYGQVTVSGGFDPLHIGHIRFFNEAKQRGTRLAVIVESDAWVAKKHQVFMPQDERAQIISQLSVVDDVICNTREDGDSTEIIKALMTDVYCVGAEYEMRKTFPEYKPLCQAGIKVQFICTTKYSSTEYLKRIQTSSHTPEWINPIPMVGCIICSDHKGVSEILLQTRADNKKLELPGGFVEVGETFVQAVEREVHEELGFVPYLSSDPTMNLVGQYRDGRSITVIVFTTYLDYLNRRFIQPNSKEVNSVDWYPISTEFDPAMFDNQVDLEAINRFIGKV